MMIEDKFEAAISDTDIIIDLYKSNCFHVLSLLFNKIYIPEFIYEKELKKVAKRHKDISLDDLKSKIEDVKSPFEVVYDKDLDIVVKNTKKALYREKYELAGPGEVECACYAKASGINIVVSNNHTEFKYLNDIAVLLSHFHILSICVFHEKINEQEAEDLYNKVNQIKSRPSSHSFQQKLDKSWDYFCDSDYIDFLKLSHCI